MLNKKLHFNGNSNGYWRDDYEYYQNRTSKKFARVRAKTPNQQLYLDAIDNNDIIFATGPAGCGKTSVATGRAAEYLRDQLCKSIVCVRPTVVSSSTNIGYLPGDIDEKLDPYMRPILTELAKYIPREEINRYRNMDPPVIEICPLQFMRGITFIDAFVIMDEAQNATRSEMKMFLSRFGEGSKLVINGDITQRDLEAWQEEGISYYSEKFDRLPGIAVVTLTNEDIVRHPIVKLMMENGL